MWKGITKKLNDAILALDETATSYAAAKTDLESVQQAVTQARLSYKKMEFYLAYHYPEFVKEHINGAPLLHIERKDSRAKVLPPEGLQVLDELVFSDEATEQKNQIAFLAKQLRNYYNQLYAGLKTVNDKGESIASVRMQLVRIFTLGLTGFDTPGSVNAIQEAQVSLEGLRDYLRQSNNRADIVTMFDKAIADLEGENFDDFDRLAFLKNHIDPLYALLSELQGKAPSRLDHSTAWNSGSKSIFSDDFLNPYFFTDITKEEDSKELRAVGKALFYDPALSAEGNISCASCHNPEKAFTDGVPKSLSSIQGKTVLRNSPTLLNAVYADRFFYDLRAFTLEQQAEHVIFNHAEFNTGYQAILQKLQKNNKYATQFKKAFGKKDITREMFSKALASYVLSLKSFNSPFDKYVRGEANDMGQDAINGFNLFMGKAACATCHFAPTFAGLVPPFYNENESEILGVPENPSALPLKIDSDKGRIDNSIISEQAWIFENSFKTTTIRNAELTAPYFHNGAYNTLEEVIDFYSDGGGTGLGLNVVNQTLPFDSLDLTEKEKKELIAFIRSLNDTSAAHN
jgi:cytochrome c peroxidase